MTFDWSQYYVLATYLAGVTSRQTDPEARLRSAISRGYYAAFCMARNHLRDKSLYQPTETAEDHVRVSGCLVELGHQGIAADLRRLRDCRNKADYRDVVPAPERLVQFALGLARRVLTQLPHV
jgi:hypothetical protein